MYSFQLHVKIGQDLKGLVDSVFGARPAQASHLFPIDNTIDVSTTKINYSIANNEERLVILVNPLSLKLI